MKRLLCLIVEDNATNIRNIKDWIGRRSEITDAWEIVFAKTVPEARRVFAERAGEIDIIFMDYRVPGADGNTTVKLTSEIASTFTGPLIACSNMDNHTLRVAGCTDSISKMRMPRMIANWLTSFPEIPELEY